jgi:hypothetical protein
MNQHTVNDIKSHLAALEEAFDTDDQNAAHEEACQLARLFSEIEATTPCQRNVRIHMRIDLIVEAPSFDMAEGKVDQLMAMAESSGMEYVGSTSHVIGAPAWGWNEEKDAFDAVCPHCGVVAEAHTTHFCPDAHPCDGCKDFYDHRSSDSKKNGSQP